MATGGSEVGSRVVTTMPVWGVLVPMVGSVVLSPGGAALRSVTPEVTADGVEGGAVGGVSVLGGRALEAGVGVGGPAVGGTSVPMVEGKSGV